MRPSRFLRGAEALLFHVTPHVLLVHRKIKIKVKGVGQECPTHTPIALCAAQAEIQEFRKISTDLFFLMFR